MTKGYLGNYELSEKPIARGGEGEIYSIVNLENIVAKIFKQEKRNKEREEKLKLMVEYSLDEVQLKQVAWPLDVLYENGEFIGYTMPRVSDASSISMVYDGRFDLRYRLLTAINLCAAVDSIHSMGQVCGDLNPQNICVNLNVEDRENAFHVTMVDVDSYHFTSGDEVFRCEVGLSEYLAPELQKKLENGVSLKEVNLPTYTKETDLFALAVHLFSLLMNGSHPCACAKDMENNEQNEEIKQMNLNYFKDSVVAPQPNDNIIEGVLSVFKKTRGNFDTNICSGVRFTSFRN